MMKITLVTSLLAIGSVSLSSAATLFFNDFDSETGIPAGWTTNNNIALWTDSSYAQSGNNTLTIVEARNSNFVTTPPLISRERRKPPFPFSGRPVRTVAHSVASPRFSTAAMA
jgi:hypothetical protein